MEARNGGYYVAGTRISLDSIAYSVRRGEDIDEILANFPALESGDKVEAVVAMIRAYPREVNAYLAESERLWEEGPKQNPPSLVEKLRKYRKERDLRSA